jgi:hypothetical protein
MVENFTLADLRRRWHYTRQGAQYLRKHDPEFPLPFVTTPTGRGNLWRLEDILAYEERRPELLCAVAKKRKVARFALAVFKKRAGA